MPNYCVRVVGPSGRETYLKKGTEVETEFEASHYPSVEIAEDNKYFYAGLLKARGEQVFLDVQMVGDPEWEHNCE